MNRTTFKIKERLLVADNGNSRKALVSSLRKLNKCLPEACAFLKVTAIFKFSNERDAL
jgi:hypothetical protein